MLCLNTRCSFLSISIHCAWLFLLLSVLANSMFLLVSGKFSFPIHRTITNLIERRLQSAVTVNFFPSFSTLSHDLCVCRSSVVLIMCVRRCVIIIIYFSYLLGAPKFDSKCRLSSFFLSTSFRDGLHFPKQFHSHPISVILSHRTYPYC